MKRTETTQRSTNVARLRATGLYTNREIGKALGIDETTVSHICNERARVPNDPFLSFEEVALVEGVNVTVVQALIDYGHLPYLSGLGLIGFNVDIHNKVIMDAVKMCDARGITKRWLSVEDAAEVAGMKTPRGMYNRALKDQVISIRASAGEAFHIDGKKGLKILVNSESIEPAQQRTEVPRQAEEEEPQAEFTMVIRSDMSGSPIIVPGRSITATVNLDDPNSRFTKQVLKLSADLTSDDRLQVKTETCL